MDDDAARVASLTMRIEEPDNRKGGLPWKLRGLHSARLDLGTRELELAERSG